MRPGTQNRRQYITFGHLELRIENRRQYIACGHLELRIVDNTRQAPQRKLQAGSRQLWTTPLTPRSEHQATPTHGRKKVGGVPRRVCNINTNAKTNASISTSSNTGTGNGAAYCKPFGVPRRPSCDRAWALLGVQTLVSAGLS